ncbi:MAG: molecular chaperone DnaJ, partial [Sphingomonadaceae bacterium]|nr:molecular chaperone DnaJ [Sphingomonadaceae bacterium]
MVGARRSNDWGFPRWRGYGSSREATTVRLCDRHGCEEKGDCPAPKAPNSPERWYFCQKHAAEYNKKWDYFEGLDKAEREARTKDERTENSG